MMFPLTLNLVIAVVISYISVSECGNIRSITVATHNVWNIMFNWEIRKFRIAQMIREVDADVIGLEELRGDDDQISSQLSDLAELLPNYQWYHYAMAHKVVPIKGTYDPGPLSEGVGVLSRLPIVQHEVQNLTSSTGSDTNSRIALHIQVLLDETYKPDTQRINLAVVHFSYDRQQQCRNAMEVDNYIQSRHLASSIVIGDFNTYKDFDGPLEVFTSEHSSIGGRCTNIVKVSDTGGVYLDAWQTTNPGINGYTFSNMPIPGLESRPDRILVSDKHFSVRSSQVLGSGDVYKYKYFYHVLWHRYRLVLAAAWDSYRGRRGRSCRHDCGPHASCRCGVCVSGGDGRACLLPHCQECNTSTIYTLVAFTVIGALLAAQLIFGALQVLLTMNERASGRQKNGCCNICLCDPALYSNMSVKVRRAKRHRFCRIWPLLRLPPMILVIVSVLMSFMYLEFVIFAFKDAINDVYSIPPEELNPSDHLLLYSVLDIKLT